MSKTFECCQDHPVWDDEFKREVLRHATGKRISGDFSKNITNEVADNLASKFGWSEEEIIRANQIEECARFLAAEECTKYFVEIKDSKVEISERINT